MMMVMDQREKIRKLVDLLPDRYVILIWSKESFKEFVDQLPPREVESILTRLQGLHFPGEDQGFIQ